MKRSISYLLAGLALLLCLLCTACGSTEDPIAPQDDPNEGLGGSLSEDTANDVSCYEGIWLGEENTPYDYLDIDAEGNWSLYLNGDVVADGYLLYEPEWESIYAYNNQDGSGGRFVLEEENRLYITTYGYFDYGDGMEDLWYEDGGNFTEDDLPDDAEDTVPNWNGRLDGDPDAYWSWNAELCQRDVSEFEGIWYCDGDLSAETYVVIDGAGNWSFYYRAPGEEPVETDYGTFSYSSDETSTYYADSDLYTDTSYRIFEFDTDALVWGDEGTFYQME